MSCYSNKLSYFAVAQSSRYGYEGTYGWNVSELRSIRSNAWLQRTADMSSPATAVLPM